MASNMDDLPEGTDRVIPGAGISGADELPIVAERAGEDGEGEDATTASDAISPQDDRSNGGQDAKTPTGADTLSDAAKSAIGGDWAGTREKLTSAGTDFTQQATDRVRVYATQGKDQAVSSLDSVARLIEDAATTVDEKVGEQYGAYVRQASEALGSFADGIRDKDVDELFTDLRDAVKNSPGVAVGAAAAIGFVLARIVKAGFDAAATPAERDGGPSA